MVKIKITLYKTEWCPFCTSYITMWNKINTFFTHKKINKVLKASNTTVLFTIIDLDDTKKKQEIIKNKVSSVPTVIITIMDDNTNTSNNSSERSDSHTDTHTFTHTDTHTFTHTDTYTHTHTYTRTGNSEDTNTQTDDSEDTNTQTDNSHNTQTDNSQDTQTDNSQDTQTDNSQDTQTNNSQDTQTSNCDDTATQTINSDDTDTQTINSNDTDDDNYREKFNLKNKELNEKFIDEIFKFDNKLTDRLKTKLNSFLKKDLNRINGGFFDYSKNKKLMYHKEYIKCRNLYLKLKNK